MDRAEPRTTASPGLARVYLSFLPLALAAQLGRPPWLVLCAAAATCGDALGRSGYSLDRRILIGSGVFALLAAWRLATLRRLVGAVLTACIASHLAYQVRFPTLPPEHVAGLAASTTVTLEASLLRDVPVAASRARMILEVERQRYGAGWRPAVGRVQLSLAATQREWQAGMRVRVALRLRRPHNFGNPSEHDYEGYLAVRGVYATAFLADDSRIEVLAAAPDSAWRRLADWRRRIGQLILQTLSPPQSEVLAALIIGYDTPLPHPLRESFRRAGVSHVLSISGLHVSLVAAAGFTALRWLLARSQWILLRGNVPKLAVAASLLPVLLYVGIAGHNLATQRAAIMIVVFLGAVLVDRQRHLLSSLSAAALVLLAGAPGSSLDVSFQLSFVAVLGLGLGVERFWAWWRQWAEADLLRLRHDWRARWVRPVALSFAVSASALAATTPLTAYHFNQVSLIAPVANAIVVPLLGSAAVVLGLVAAMLLPLSETAATVVLHLAAPAVWLGIQLTQLCARLPLAALRCVTPSSFELLWIYAVLLALMAPRSRSRGRLLLLLLWIGLVDAAWWYQERFLHRDLRVTFLSVGQGDSTLLELPGGEVMVVDGGGSFGSDFDMGERVVAPYLWSRKIGHIDYLVLTHPDRDHYGGLSFLAENFSPREWWSTGATTSGQAFEALSRAVGAAHRVEMRAGARRTIGGVTLDVLGPESIDSGSDNDGSLVLRVELGGRRLLLTGDIERQAEERLVTVYAADLRSDLLKVPHHGSRSSSSRSFLAHVRPRLAVASMGFENRFRFPHPEVVQRYAEHGSALWRTDRDGAVRAQIDPDGTMRIDPDIDHGVP